MSPRASLSRPRETRLETNPVSQTSRALILGLGAATLLVQIGCGGAPKASPEVEPAPPTQVAPVVEPPPPPLPPPIREVQPKSRSKVKVIDPGDSPDEPKTLIEASRLAKARKKAGVEKPVHVIDDDNLAEYAEGAEVILLEGEPAAQMPTEEELDAAESDGELRGEDYWRNRALDLRMAWRRTIDEMNRLQLESASLRQQFYAEDDPYIRDSQIKPNWDRVLDRLETLKRESRRYEQELEAFKEEGRRSGALQGWLNEGWELEPTGEELLKFSDEVGEVDEFGEPSTVNPGKNIGEGSNPGG